MLFKLPFYKSSNNFQDEASRYSARANKLLYSSIDTCPNVSPGLIRLPIPLQSPYIYYEFLLDHYIEQTSSVLELGSGTGEFTRCLLQNSDEVYATDLSLPSLKLLKARFPGNNSLTIIQCDMESLPFMDEQMDYVVCAGALSYADNNKVMDEIFRVLAPGGSFICVDSLNHNIIYKVNRFIHYLRSNRSYSTLKRMPTLKLLDQYEKKFGSISVNYFGLFSWLTPLLLLAIPSGTVKLIMDSLDDFFMVKRNAFKFVMIAVKSGF